MHIGTTTNNHQQPPHASYESNQRTITIRLCMPHGKQGTTTSSIAFYIFVHQTTNKLPEKNKSIRSEADLLKLKRKLGGILLFLPYATTPCSLHLPWSIVVEI